MLFADFVVGRTVRDERPFSDDGGGGRGETETAFVRSELQKERKSRMGGNGLQLLSKIRDAAEIRLQQREFFKKRNGFAEHLFRRRVEPWEIEGVAEAEGRDGENGFRQIQPLDFRDGFGRFRVLLQFGPKPLASACGFASCAAGPLVRRVSRYLLCFQYVDAA